MLRTGKVLAAAAVLVGATAAIYGTGAGSNVMAAGKRPVVVTVPAPSPAAPTPAPTGTRAPSSTVTQKPTPAVTQAPSPAPGPLVTHTTPAKEQVPPTGPQWDKAPALQQAVNQAMASFPGRYSIAVYDLKADKRFTVNETARFHPASTLKIPVTLYALELHRAGKLGWNDLIAYTKDDFEPPDEEFEKAPEGSLYPVSDLVSRALIHSNNVATNMLGRHLGWGNIRTWTRSIGAELYREPDAAPSANALSELGWWRHLEQLSRQDPKKAELLLGPLREATYQGRIAAGLPKGVPFVHKYGTYDGYYHDAGWVMGDRPFLLVVLTHGATVDEADVAIAGVTQAIYQVMMQ